MKENNFSQLMIATEAISFFDLHLDDFLAKNFRPTIYQSNPKLISNFKKAYTKKEKTDKNYAFVIFVRSRFSRLPRTRLTNYRFYLIETFLP
jgi:hypothetical protein